MSKGYLLVDHDDNDDDDDDKMAVDWIARVKGLVLMQELFKRCY